MSVFGKRHNVTVWRERQVVTYHKLNLNDSKAYSSPYFYLKQNDVVVCRAVGISCPLAAYKQNSYKVSVISAIVSGVSVITSLVLLALVINKK